MNDTYMYENGSTPPLLPEPNNPHVEPVILTFVVLMST